MKRYISISVAFVVLVLIISNCSDDPCPVCPTETTLPSLYAIGSVNSKGDYFWAYIDVYDVTGSGDQVDSASVDGDFVRFCIRNTPHTVSNDGRQILTHLGSEACPAGGVLMEFLPGDTTEVVLFCREIAHRTQLHLLDRIDSRPGNVQISADQALNQVSISWNEIDDAEWYAVKIKTQSTAPYYVWEYYNLETTTLIAPLPLPYIAIHEVEIYVAAGTGPQPTIERPTHNLTGKYIAGSIYSVSDDVRVTRVLNSFVNKVLPDNIDSPPSIADFLRHGGRLTGGND